jgi:hypothetical protein
MLSRHGAGPTAKIARDANNVMIHLVPVSEASSQPRTIRGLNIALRDLNSQIISDIPSQLGR